MNDDSQPENKSSLMWQPVVVIALAILLGVFVLIGAAIFGLDHGVLSSMANSGFARGLITYLFAVVTIGTAVVLVVSVLTSEPSVQNKERFERGKEVLSLLLGVFGTIVGFYFGSEIGARDNLQQANRVQVTQPLLSQQHVNSGQQVTLTAAVSGGVSPYQFGIGLGEDAEVEIARFVDANGWIVRVIDVPVVERETIIPIKVSVRDAGGSQITTSANLAVSPAAAKVSPD